ncbi:MAG: hypothetical protein M9955_24800 [Rhizobiaceae bacterium]|nr:hypothetical protein [Rhizobiaceae bacterium]
MYRDVIDSVSTALEAHGLLVRGGFNFAAAAQAPPALSDSPARAVILVGNAGAGYWPHFQRWRDAQPAVSTDPLDTWCREVIGAVAARSGARAISPSDRPFQPFQQWAMRAEGLRPSPLGILMHPEYGLWHAYRGALLFDVELPFDRIGKPIHLCDACTEKPCLKACPVEAYTEAGFDYRGCLAFASSARGGDCREKGCLDRNACPHGAGYRYPAAIQAFHMASFLRPAM